ncbi:MAG: hypothetical protein U5J64_01345 [Halobacteriales archaeon]|nr:hypothetical protein [Halobacteriales archaeon]
MAGNRTFPDLLLLILLLTVVSVTATGTVTAQEDQQTVTVSNADDLDDVRDDLDGDYVLANDIDMSDVGNFDPIGSRDGASFTGSFEGGGNVISDLTVVEPNGDGVGLFGAVGDGGTVNSVGLEDVDVEGDKNVGGIVGFNRGNVTRSYVTGTVSGESDNVGGVVGWNRGGLVSKSYSKARVNGNVQVGGIVGVSNSAAGSDGDAVVEFSYAVGRVSATARDGGLVGMLGDRDQLSGTESVLRDSYWDTGATGQNDEYGNKRSGDGESTAENVEGLSTDEMQGDAAEDNMTAFDFVSTWATQEDDYPVLSWQTSVLSADNVPLPGFGFFAAVVSLFAVLVHRTTNRASDR